MVPAGSQHAMPVESPCNKVCTIDPASQLCRGCGRTLTEIAQWTVLTDAARARVMAELPQRLARMQGPAAAAAT
jgi:predicted Fe-S protein YdhL (DUF1289 family)